MTAHLRTKGSVLTPFVTPMFRTKLSGVGDLNRDAESVIIERMKHFPSDTRSSMGGWQSTEDFHHWPNESARQLSKLCVEVVVDALSSHYPGAAPITVEPAECWANVNQRGSWNAPHTHGFPWVASYYIRTRSEEGHMGAICLGNPTAFCQSLWQKPEICIEPEESELIIFPGGYTHYVEPNTTSSLRIGLAFNFHVRTATRPWSMSVRHTAQPLSGLDT